MKESRFQRTRSLLLSASLLFFPITTWCENIAVIVNKDNKSKISQEELKLIYKGQMNKFQNGLEISPLNQSEKTTIKTEFIRKVTQQPVSRYKSYWTRKIFTGKGVPPREITGGDEAVKKYVEQNPEAIGYISSSSADKTVHVLMEF